MKMNAGAWIGIIGGIIGFAAGIIAVLSTTGSTGVYIVSGMLLLFGGMAWVFYKVFFQQMILAARLKKNGIDGTAVIKEVNDTGVTVNYNPQVKLLLEVKDNIGQIYTTTLRTLVSRVQPDLYKPGMRVEVKIDPKNQKNVIINTASIGRQPISTFTPQHVPPFNRQSETSFTRQPITSIQHDVENLTKLENELLSRGKSARALIKSEQWLGANINGNNPYMEFTVEVLPAEAPAFEGKVKGVISGASVNKYQPGCEIYVKYDDGDRNKIIIEHS